MNKLLQEEIEQLIKLYTSGHILETEIRCTKLLETYPQSHIIYNILGASLQGQKKINEAINKYNKSIELKPDYAEAYSNLGVALQALGKYEESIKSYYKAIELKPYHAEAFSNCANALKEIGKLEEAVLNYDKAINLKPDYAEAYNNKGATLFELNRLEEALITCKRATEIKPDFSEAFFNYSNALKEIGKLEEAVLNYDKAINLKPDYAEAYNNKGATLFELHRLGEAGESYRKALTFTPKNNSLWSNYAKSLHGIEFNSSNEELIVSLNNLLNYKYIDPPTKAIFSALRTYPKFTNIFNLINNNITSENLDQITHEFSKIPLLLKIMELSPIRDIDIEKAFTKLRLMMLDRVENNEIRGLPFYISMAMQCFINGYVFFISNSEKQKISRLEKRIVNDLKKNIKIDEAKIAILGSYIPLSKMSWANDLISLQFKKEINKLISIQILNFETEKKLKSQIKSISKVNNLVSKKVKNQYEESPYPNWVNALVMNKSKSVLDVLKLINCDFNINYEKVFNKPQILVAGCGTGQHALGTATRFSDSNVTALDLSFSSLSYAKRKTDELGISNIEYVQGDILNIDQLNKNFDIIESAGVLHHMDEPLLGWEKLVKKLNTGGLMKIGLYSEIARRNIVEMREYIDKRTYGPTEDSIRLFRKDVTDSSNISKSNISEILKFKDFYSLNGCRDLLFNIKEHRFTIPQIEESLKMLNLNFLGFEMSKTWVKNRFKKINPQKDSLFSLSLWNEFEIKNPNTFTGMYQFWVQKI